MSLAILIVPAAIAVVATVMGHRKTPGVRVIKTVVTALLTVIAAAAVVVAAADSGGQGIWWFFVASLALATVADWLLAPVDNSRTFVAGLVFFLLAYLLYAVVLIGVSAASVAAAAPVVGAVVLALALALALAQYRTLRTVPPGLRGAVIAYMVVATALLLGGGWYFIAGGAGGAPTGAAVPSLILAGTVFIYLSDSLIAHNLFRRPLTAEQLWIMPTYYAGQLLMTAAVILGSGTGGSL